MKLIFAVVNNDDVNSLMELMIKSSIGVTKLSSTGGFLKARNTTLMIGLKMIRLRGIGYNKAKSSKKTITIAASISEPVSGDAYASIL